MQTQQWLTKWLEISEQFVNLIKQKYEHYEKIIQINTNIFKKHIDKTL